MSTLTQFLGGDGLPVSYFKAITSDETWVAPKDMKIVIMAIGGGGSGGATVAGFSGGTTRRATGGGAGGFCKKSYSVQQGQSLSIVVGSGGVGFATNTEAQGADGGSTTVTGASLSLTASGGNGGQAVESTTNILGGAGGAATGGEVNNVGGKGGDITGIGAGISSSSGGSIKVNNSYIADASNLLDGGKRGTGVSATQVQGGDLSYITKAGIIQVVVGGINPDDLLTPKYGSSASDLQTSNNNFTSSATDNLPTWSLPGAGGYGAANNYTGSGSQIAAGAGGNGIVYIIEDRGA